MVIHIRAIMRNRPGLQLRIPSGKFTIAELCAVNGVDPKTGKGPKCSKLTLINALKRLKRFDRGSPTA
jgi:hypothetical protein